MFLFVGFALMAGGLAGSVVRPSFSPSLGTFASRSFNTALSPPLSDIFLSSQTILIVKYIVPGYPENFGVNWGVATVLQSSTFLLSFTPLASS